jgi:hypothetical protein
MMRVATILAVEAGIPICMCVHDALPVVDREERIDATAAAIREIMARASRIVTGGLEIRVGIEMVHADGRYDDPRGRAMWSRVMKLLESFEKQTSGTTEAVRRVAALGPVGAVTQM